MKKFTFLFALMVLVAFAWGQRVNSDMFKSRHLERADKVTRVQSNYASDYMNHLKDVNAQILLEEHFEGTFPPTGWTQQTGPTNRHWEQIVGDNFANNGTQIAFHYWEAIGIPSDDWLVTPSVTIPNSGQPSKLVFDWISTYYWNHSPNDNADININISTDGGTTWSLLWSEDDSTMVINSGVEWPWPTYEWRTSFVDLSSYAGQTVIFAWQYTGNDGGSFWMDNVFVYEAPHYDVKFYDYRNDFYGFNFGSYSMVPWPFPMAILSWAKPQSYGTDVTTNISMDVEIIDGNGWGGTVFTGTSNVITSMNELDIDSLTIDTATYFVINDPLATSTADLDQFEITLTLNTTEIDELPADNVKKFYFAETDSVYGRDNNAPAFPYTGPLTWADGGGDGDKFGSRYDFNNASDVEVNSLSFYVSQYSGEGSSIVAFVAMSDGAGDFVPVVESAVYDITASDLGTWVTLPFDKDGFSEFLPAETYVGGIEIIAYNGVEFWIAEDNETPQAPYATFWNLVNSSTGGWFYASNYSQTPFIRLNIQSDLPLAIENQANINTEVMVYPNPTNGELNIVNVKNANVTVYNLVGEVVASFNNVFNKVDISELANGSYIVKVVDENKTTTQKINLVK